MPASIEKTYSDALISLIEDEHGAKAAMLTSVLGELECISNALSDAPEFVKVMNTPTISREEKDELLDKVFKASSSEITYNFLRVLASKQRIGYFDKIFREYKKTYNDLFGITEITVTTTAPLDDALRQKIRTRMETVTGKTVTLKEKTDKALIGGIVIDYGNTRLDGSVKTRLDALGKDIANIIA